MTVPIYQDDISVEDALPDLSASAVYVMDRESGAILFQRNAEVARYPASVAKLMTALVSRQLYALDKVLEVKEEAFTTGTVVGLQIGEKLTVADLLHALLIPSGNDAAFVLANNHPLGYRGFINDMNVKAQQLHLTRTFYENPSGLDIEKQESTARDIAILSHEVMKDPVLREMVGRRTMSITDISGTIVHELHTTHELLGQVEGVVGIKTGTTAYAGENLVTQVERDGHEIIIVVLGSEDRFLDTRNIIDWTFTHYEWQTVSR